MSSSLVVKSRLVKGMHGSISFAIVPLLSSPWPVLLLLEQESEEAYNSHTCTRIRRKGMRSWGGGSGGAGVGVESLVRVRRWANKKAGRRRENARCTEKNHTKCIFHKSLFPCPTQAAQHETSLGASSNDNSFQRRLPWSAKEVQ